MQDKNNVSLLDSELAKLKAIGLKEISKSTKLANSKIEDVLEKRFDKIDRVRAKGFIAILEREYDVDLRDWLLLYERSKNEDIKSVSQVIAKQDEEQRAQRLKENAAKEEQIAKEKEQKQNEEKKREHQVLDLALKGKPIAKSDTESYSWLYVILVLILLALMGYFAYKAFMQDHQKSNLAPISQSNTHTSSQEDGYDGLFFDTSSIQVEAQSIPEAVQEQDTPQKGEAVSTESSNAYSKPLQEPLQSHPEQNFFFQPQNTSSSQEAQKKVINDNILHIQSDFDLWLGVINLETGTKEQFSYKKEYDIKLEGKMLFIMGHSSFTLTLNGEDIPHGTKHPVRMYYDGSTLRNIGYTRFKELNGGLEW
ncbi:hypothetical protein V3I05_00845 [Helicobacter mastomyrinus]|uniref:Sialidase A n=1 Tax=Helicobacter mastomyrinus TaxID=287948 RepID=A0ABZ3F871_9HELI